MGPPHHTIPVQETSSVHLLPPCLLTLLTPSLYLMPSKLTPGCLNGDFQHLGGGEGGTGLLVPPSSQPVSIFCAEIQAQYPHAKIRPYKWLFPKYISAQDPFTAPPPSAIHTKSPSHPCLDNSSQLQNDHLNSTPASYNPFFTASSHPALTHNST